MSCSIHFRTAAESRAWKHFPSACHLSLCPRNSFAAALRKLSAAAWASNRASRETRLTTSTSPCAWEPTRCSVNRFASKSSPTSRAFLETNRPSMPGRNSCAASRLDRSLCTNSAIRLHCSRRLPFSLAFPFGLAFQRAALIRLTLLRLDICLTKLGIISAPEDLEHRVLCLDHPLVEVLAKLIALAGKSRVIDQVFQTIGIVLDIVELLNDPILIELVPRGQSRITGRQFPHPPIRGRAGRGGLHDSLSIGPGVEDIQ